MAMRGGRAFGDTYVYRVIFSQFCMVKFEECFLRSFWKDPNDKLRNLFQLRSLVLRYSYALVNIIIHLYYRDFQLSADSSRYMTCFHIAFN